MFTKYEKTSNETKVLLMYLILNGYSLAKVDRLEEVEENRLFGLTVKKLYGLTNEYVDVGRIEREIEAIQSPIVCSKQTYEYYCDEPNIYAYEKQIAEAPLWINDMGIISKVMVISDDIIISSNKAKPATDANQLGFMYFYDYVTKEKCEIGKWKIIYDNKVFSVYYLSTNGDKTTKELLFSAIEIDKTSTYKLVLYIIIKASSSVEEWLSDNYVEQSYTLVTEGK